MSTRAATITARFLELLGAAVIVLGLASSVLYLVAQATAESASQRFADVGASISDDSTFPATTAVDEGLTPIDVALAVVVALGAATYGCLLHAAGSVVRLLIGILRNTSIRPYERPAAPAPG